MVLCAILTITLLQRGMVTASAAGGCSVCRHPLCLHRLAPSFAWGV